MEFISEYTENTTIGQYCMYKISALSSSDSYVGVCKDIYGRIQEHKRASSNENHSNYSFKLYKWIRENDGWDNLKIEVIQSNIISKREALEIERKYLMDHKPSLNTMLPQSHQSQKERESACIRQHQIYGLKKMKKNCNLPVKLRLKSKRIITILQKGHY